LSATISSLLRSQRRRLSKRRKPIPNKSEFSPPNTSRLKLVLSSPRGPFRNYRRKSTDLKTNCVLNRNVTRCCKRTWRPHSRTSKTSKESLKKLMSWSTKKRNSRPSLTNSTRPSPRCPATKSLLSNPLQIYFPKFFSFAKKHKMFSRFVCHQNLEFCSTTFLYDFSPSHKLFPSYLKKKRNHSLQSR